MNPNQAANRLRFIASVLDKSKRPSKSMIARRIQNVLVAMDPQAMQRMTPSQIFSQALLQEPFDYNMNMDEIALRIRGFAEENGIDPKLAEAAVSSAEMALAPGGILSDE